MDLSVLATSVQSEVLQGLPKACAYVKKSLHHDCDDSALLDIRQEYVLIGVFDGVSGHPFARQAGETALKTVREYVAKKSGSKSPEILVEDALLEANFAVTKGGTTACIVIVLNDGRFFFASLGDSHLYQQTGEGIRRLTQDERESSSLTTYMANRYVVTQCLGGLVRSVDKGQGKLSKGDRLLACTDGITDNLYVEIEGSRIVDTSGRADLEQMLDMKKEPKDAVPILIHEIKRRMQQTQESIKYGGVLYPKEDDAAIVMLKY